MGQLTARQIDSLNASGTYEDGDGLRLVVKATGRKSWVFRYQRNGKRSEMGLGSYPTVSLKDARALLAEQRRLLSEGQDPKTFRDDAKAAALLSEQKKAAKIVTVQVLVDDYIAAHRTGWKNAKHAQQWENTLNTYAMPIIGKMEPGAVTTEHVLAILQPIWAEKTETASRVRNRLELVLDAAKARGLRSGENPARWRGHLDKLLPNRAKVQKRTHHPALPWKELPEFMRELSQYQDSTHKAMQMTILTACRTSEVLNAKWSEIDTEEATWNIPGDRMKSGRAHRVPLSDAVLKLLSEVQPVAGNPYIFAGAKAGRPLSNMSMLMGLRRLGREEITMHGFRSTFRDWAAESTHYPREVCEMALAHVVAEGAEAAYWRSDIFEKRRALMAEWAAYATTEPSKKVIRGDFKRA